MLLRYLLFQSFCVINQDPGKVLKTNIETIKNTDYGILKTIIKFLIMIKTNRLNKMNSVKVTRLDGQQQCFESQLQTGGVITSYFHDHTLHLIFIKKIKELNGVKCQLENDRVRCWKLVLLDYHCHERKPKTF